MFCSTFMKNPSICSASCEPHFGTCYNVTLAVMSLRYLPQCGITHSVWSTLCSRGFNLTAQSFRWNFLPLCGPILKASLSADSTRHAAIFSSERLTLSSVLAGPVFASALRSSFLFYPFQHTHTHSSFPQSREWELQALICQHISND